MAILRPREIRMMSKEERAEKLKELRQSLMDEMSKLASTGMAENPGRIGAIRRTIARIETINRGTA